MFNNATLFGVMVLALAGCSHSKPKSDAWRRAEESTAREEWTYTNGMAWPQNASSNELVMSPGMQITARTVEGEIIIRAGKGLERSYTWDGATRSATLWPRRTRWYGSLGIYFPGPGEHWKPHQGITRGVLDEGILWFKTVDDMLWWVNDKRKKWLRYEYTDDGLMVGWLRYLGRKQLNVEVWQIMIDGKKPHSLPGSRNDLISVSKGVTH